MKLSSILLATAMIAAPAYAGSQAMNDDHAEYGHCTAYEASEQGREHGNASEAEPFQALEENASAANQSVEEYCEDVEHPAEEHRPEDPGAQAEEHRPDDAGDEADDRREDDEHRPEDAEREDEDRGQPEERRGPP